MQDSFTMKQDRVNTHFQALQKVDIADIGGIKGFLVRVIHR